MATSRQCAGVPPQSPTRSGCLHGYARLAVDGIADIEGNYPTKGSGERGAWVRDSEGNVLGIGKPIRV